VVAPGCSTDEKRVLRRVCRDSTDRKCGETCTAVLGEVLHNLRTLLPHAMKEDEDQLVLAGEVAGDHRLPHRRDFAVRHCVCLASIKDGARTASELFGAKRKTCELK
jgi:hypothetical protein